MPNSNFTPCPHKIPAFSSRGYQFLLFFHFYYRSIRSMNNLFHFCFLVAYKFFFQYQRELRVYSLLREFIVQYQIYFLVVSHI